MRTYQTISADGHLEVPLDWSTRVPLEVQGQGARLVRNADGSEVWVMDEWTRDNIGNLYCGLRYDQYVPAAAAPPTIFPTARSVPAPAMPPSACASRIPTV